jgi:hypothetical protein
LAEAQPDAVREVLTRAIGPELKTSGATNRCDALEKISRADMTISSLLADQLFEHLRRHEALRSVVLGPMLRILHAGYKNTGALASLLRERFERSSTVEQGSTYFAILFELNPAQAIVALDAKLAALTAGNQTALVQGILPKLFGGRWEDGSVRPGEIPFKSLEPLLLVAFGAIRLEDDNDHSDDQVYTQDDRDDAERARNALFKAFIETPGLATFDAIHRLIVHPDFPTTRKRMLHIARDRAGSDSEPAP